MRTLFPFWRTPVYTPPYAPSAEMCSRSRVIRPVRSCNWYRISDGVADRGCNGVVRPDRAGFNCLGCGDKYRRGVGTKVGTEGHPSVEGDVVRDTGGFLRSGVGKGGRSSAGTLAKRGDGGRGAGDFKPSLLNMK